MVIEIKQRTVTKDIVQSVAVCPKCKKEIIGNSKGQVEYNFGVHTRTKHPTVKIENGK